MNWPKHPLIYEINAWAWLAELASRHHRSFTLGTIPPAEWDAVAELGMDAVWLMGVWERSPAGVAVAMANPQLQKEFRQVLPDLQPQDIVGSPYCIRRYAVDDRLGGTAGLAVARKELTKRNTRLVLDFVPNHVAPDHPWVSAHPEYFVRGDRDDLQRDPASFFESAGTVFARGRDPYFPAWPDVLQLNAFNNGLRNVAIETLTSIAEQSDGVRCDMAMLLLNEVFSKTWGDRAGPQPSSDYWATVIPAVKKKYPSFLFIAEAYWDLEWKLQQQGFDYCYDKQLYDRLCCDNPESVRLHLCADLPYQERLIRFIENHDEPRAASVFSPQKEQVAAIMTMTLPGAKLLHEGQIDGMKVRLPVFLARRPSEPGLPALRAFCSSLLKVVHRDVFRNGRWLLCERSGWPDNPSFQNLIAWCWDKDQERYLIVVNASESRSQARVRVPWDDLPEGTCRLTDALSGQIYDRTGDEMRSPGLFVDLEGWGFNCFQVQALTSQQAIAA